jgi:hypothetical protein
MANLKLIWRSRGFYSTGAEETELIAGADLAALQRLTAADGMAGRLSE